MLETLNPSSLKRINGEWDLFEDKEACQFAINCGDKLYSIVDADHHARQLFDDGEFTVSRKFKFSPKFFSICAALDCIEKLGPHFFTTDSGKREVPIPLILSLSQAAKARLEYDAAQKRCSSAQPEDMGS